MTNPETIYNRPFVEGKPVEGPEPFMNSMTLVEGLVIGAVGKNHWQDSGWTPEQMAHLVAFRDKHPINYEDEATSYSPESQDFPRLEPLEQYRTHKTLGNRALNLLTGRRRK